MIPDSSKPSAPASPAIFVFLFLAFAVGIGTGYLVWGREANELRTALAAAEQGAAAAPAAQDAPARRYDVPVEADDPALGPPGAPVTIVEFSDFACPYCRKWHLTVWPQIQETYGEQVRLVYRDYPLGGVRTALPAAAEAANCAGEQDRYWDYHDELFSGLYPLDGDGFAQAAAELELDEAAFGECLDSRRTLEEVAGDYEFASRLGVSAAPTFFINGIALVGAQPYAAFERLIEQELE